MGVWGRVVSASRIRLHRAAKSEFNSAWDVTPGDPFAGDTININNRNISMFTAGVNYKFGGLGVLITPEKMSDEGCLTPSRRCQRAKLQRPATRGLYRPLVGAKAAQQFAPLYSSDLRHYVPDRRPRRGKAGRDVCARDGCQPLGDDPHHADHWRQGAQRHARPRACHHQAHQGVSYQNRGFLNRERPRHCCASVSGSTTVLVNRDLAWAPIFPLHRVIRGSFKAYC